MIKVKEKWHGRGTATIYEDDSIEFRPCAKGEPSQKNVKRSGSSKFYETNGEKESSYVAHLMTSKESIDPVGDMLKDFGTLTKELQPQLPEEPRTKPLMKKDGLSVYLDAKEHKLKVFCEILLDAETTAYSPADWAYTLIAQPLNICFTSKRKDILSAYLQPAKTSIKR